jgi:hypothetical protein
MWTATDFFPFRCSRTNLPPTYLGSPKRICLVVREGTLSYAHYLCLRFTDIVNDGDKVTFTSVDPDLYPLPDRRYLTLHAAVAKVVHMAGIAEYLDDLVRKYENIRVLSEESHVEHLDGLLRIAQRSALVTTSYDEK